MPSSAEPGFGGTRQPSPRAGVRSAEGQGRGAAFPIFRICVAEQLPGRLSLSSAAGSTARSTSIRSSSPIHGPSFRFGRRLPALPNSSGPPFALCSGRPPLPRDRLVRNLAPEMVDPDPHDRLQCQHPLPASRCPVLNAGSKSAARRQAEPEPERPAGAGRKSNCMPINK